MTTNNERDTKFLGFAKLHYPELSKLFFTMYAHIEEHRSIEKIDSIEDEIRTLIAQRAYDLVVYCFQNAPTATLEHANLRVGMDEEMQYIPDMTEWPKSA